MVSCSFAIDAIHQVASREKRPQDYTCHYSRTHLVSLTRAVNAGCEVQTVLQQQKGFIYMFVAS